MYMSNIGPDSLDKQFKISIPIPGAVTLFLTLGFSLSWVPVTMCTMVPQHPEICPATGTKREVVKTTCYFPK